MRIAFAGPTGAGKTTSAQLAQRLIPGACLLSVAEPLKHLQGEFYRVLGQPLPSWSGIQDGSLMVAIRDLLHARHPNFLEDHFRSRVMSLGSTPIVNDDFRKAMLPTMRALGFTLIWVERAVVRPRADITPHEASGHPHGTPIADTDCSLVLDNSGGLTDLTATLERLLASPPERTA